MREKQYKKHEESRKEIDNFQKIKDYYENIQIEFLNELYGFEDEELFDKFGNKIEYTTNGKHAIFDYLWK